MRIVDAHHHLWDLQAVEYPWLMATGVKRFFGDPTPIQKNYLAADLRDDASGFELEGSVHVQVGVAAGSEVEETRWLQETGEREGLPSVIVAYCELEREDIDKQLDAQQRYSRLRGVRQIVGRSDEEDAKTGSGALLDNPRWVDGLALLAERGLRFDLQLTPRQLHRCAEVFSDLPDLKVALCHCGSPWDQSTAGLQQWRDGLNTLAALPNVHCKISGLGMFNHDWTQESIKPLVESCLEIFSPDRCMFGSNFPVDKLHASYAKIWQAYLVLTDDLDAAARDALFRGNAKSFYRF
ncbi:MAG: amidohydrolase family protein [Woeseiaceae bacterium]|nr:amidohydrolase family protein [Woeseiaceae bacterium]